MINHTHLPWNLVSFQFSPSNLHLPFEPFRKRWRPADRHAAPGSDWLAGHHRFRKCCGQLILIRSMRASLGCLHAPTSDQRRPLPVCCCRYAREKKKKKLTWLNSPPGENFYFPAAAYRPQPNGIERRDKNSTQACLLTRNLPSEVYWLGNLVQ